MKILFFNYEYPPLGGGAGNATYYILREFSKIPDFEVDLITSSIDSDFHAEKIGNNVKIYRLPIGKNKQNLHFQSKKDILIYTWKSYFFAKKLIAKNKYDLSHSFFSVPCGYISYKLKKRFKMPYIVSLRGADVPGYSERFTTLYAILKPLIREIWSEANYVIYNSQGLKDLATKTNGRQEINVIPNGINTDEFKPDLKKYDDLETRLSNRLSSQNFKILCVSRLTPRKGIKYLIEAFKNLSKKYKNLELIIVGEGDDKNNLINLSGEEIKNEKIKFTGLVPHNKLPEIYQTADVFVLPSLNEGMSNTMLEALACGLPLIATDTGGTQELIQNGKNGFIVKMKNPDDLAKKIQQLIKNPELRNKMGFESRKLAENFSWQKVAEKYFELYKKIYLIG